MSQTATPQAAPAPAPAAPAVPAAAPAPQGEGDPAHVDTPALLNRWQLIGMSTAILFGILSALVQLLGWESDGRAAEDTEQLRRVQSIQSSLLSADALATNAFLVGGLENTGQRTEYDATINEVLAEIAAAAMAQPADQAALVALNKQVNRYATSIAQARANNRQGFPVGAAYQSAASDQLRNETIPILDDLVAANKSRAEDAMGGQHPLWLLGLGVAALGVLWWINRSLAQAFKRRVNKGLALAAAIVAAITAVSVAGAWIKDSSNDSLRNGEFAEAAEAATARTAANDAKANESLGLIKRGSGALNEDNWKKQAAVVVDESPSELLENWRSYATTHSEIVQLDESNRWEQAVEKATQTGTEENPTPFEAFDSNLKQYVEESSSKAVDDLENGRTLLLILSILTALLGIVGAMSVARGIGERRREFS